MLAATNSYQPDETYVYDVYGNRKSAGYQAGADNRLLAGGTVPYQYDAEVNRISGIRLSSGEVTEYTQDAPNRLARIVNKGAQGQVTQTVDCQYVPFDRRLQKSIAPVVGPPRAGPDRL